MIKQLRSEKIHRDQWQTIHLDEIEFADGTKGTYAWVDRKSSAAVVIVTKDDRIFLQKEYRYPADVHSWEIPGGAIEAGESPSQAAVRELLEETGIKLEETSLERVGQYYPLNSMSGESVTLFSAHIDEPATTLEHTESTEEILDHGLFSFEEVYRMIDDGRICDASTAHAVQWVMRRSSGT